MGKFCVITYLKSHVYTYLYSEEIFLFYSGNNKLIK